MPLVATGLVIGGLPAPARAGGPGDPIIGDFNGDGTVDTATLALAVGDSIDCQVEVREGTGPVHTHTYLVLPNDQPNCPDMGTAGDVDNSGFDEIVVTWFAGPPPGFTDTLLTLRLYELVHESPGVFQPSFIGTADVNGDGYNDVYEWTDQGEGYATFLSDGRSGFSPGPEKYCANPLSVTVRDMDHDRAADALISYIENCADFSSGVVVVFDDGSVQQLQRDPDGLRTWTARVVNANHDGRPDIRTVDNTTGQVRYFINNGKGAFVPAPKAVPDHVTIRGYQPTVINVLANDYVGPDATISIARPPLYGRALARPDGTIVYTPNPGPGRDDFFRYRVTEGGRVSSAGVGISFAR